MSNKVTRICVSCILLVVDSTRARIWGAVVVDDNLIHRENSKGPGYAARGCNPLIRSLETTVCQQTFSEAGNGNGIHSLCDDTAGNCNRHRVLAPSGWLKPGAGLEGVDFVTIVQSPFLLEVSAFLVCQNKCRCQAKSRLNSSSFGANLEGERVGG